LFFVSAAANPSVDIALISDRKISVHVPSNVHVIEISRGQLAAKFEATLGIKLGEFGGHKLCDFRPFFGLIFAELVGKYEFWGFCDIDIMFGNLSKVVNEDFLSTVDVFTACDRQIVGHFTIVRNLKWTNELCYEISDWKYSLAETENTMLDEMPFYNAISSSSRCRLVQPKQFDMEIRQSPCKFGVTFGFRGEIAFSANEQFGVARWCNGSTFLQMPGRAEVEVLYIHFMGLKRWWHWLFYTKKGGGRRCQYFSRIGYGRSGTADVSREPWRSFYWIQLWLTQRKTYIGQTLRKRLSRETFRRLRRLLLGRSRY
jgi:hypothetical protein